jgi:hypothetical protein
MHDGSDSVSRSFDTGQFMNNRLCHFIRIDHGRVGKFQVRPKAAGFKLPFMGLGFFSNGVRPALVLKGVTPLGIRLSIDSPLEITDYSGG